MNALETKKSKKVGGGPPTRKSQKKQDAYVRKQSTRQSRYSLYQPRQSLFKPRKSVYQSQQDTDAQQETSLTEPLGYQKAPKAEKSFPEIQNQPKKKKDHVTTAVSTHARQRKVAEQRVLMRRHMYAVAAVLLFLGLFGTVFATVVWPTLQGPCSYSGDPTELQLLECKRHVDGHQCTFDVTRCGIGCILGYESDEYACAISCNCATRGLFEADISFSDVSIDLLLTAYIREEDSVFDDETPGSASIYNNIWDLDLVNGRVRVPYVMAPSILSRPSGITAIQVAMDGYSRLTCIDFVPRTTEQDFLEIVGDRGVCSSFIGRIGGRQAVSIGDRCERLGTIQHEFMHALGFYHEQSRPDRDDFVLVNWANIESSKVHNFRKRGLRSVRGFSSPYDLGSVMHYGGYSFSSNSLPSLVDKTNNNPINAQRVGLSQEDLIEINALYLCPHATDTTVTQDGDHWDQWSAWHPCSSSCGEGYETRVRECLDVSDQRVHHGRCTGEAFQRRDCDSGSCVQGEWGQWSQCSSSCGGGKRHRSTCCYPRSTSKIETCNNTPCPTGSNAVASWSPWSLWTPCSRTCGTGWRRRTRKCVDVLHNVVSTRLCPWKLPSYVDMETCNIDPCPDSTGAVVVLNWEPWESWGSCSASCGLGARLRYRKCPAGGVCVGDSDQLKGCKILDCPAQTDQVLAAWGPWSGLSLCSAACGGGTATRIRYCYGANYEIVGTCLGIGAAVSQEEETVDCNEQPCSGSTSRIAQGRMDSDLTYGEVYSGKSNNSSPHWSRWTLWSYCSASCGVGSQTRRRICMFGKVGFEGCVDNWMQSQKCDAGECIDQGLWGDWQDWSACSKSCNGTRTRSRICYVTNRVDVNACNGPSQQQDTCQHKLCNPRRLANASRLWDNRTLLCDGGILSRADVNADEAEDLICVHNFKRVTLILNKLGGSFVIKDDADTDLCVTAPGDLLFADFNGDGATDIMCFDRVNKNSRITFVKDSSFLRSERYDWALSTFCTNPSSRLSTARLNRDAKADLLCLDVDGGASALLNEF